MDIKYLIILIGMWIIYKIITNICDAYVTTKYFEEKKNETILSPLPKLKDNRYVESNHKRKNSEDVKRPKPEEIHGNNTNSDDLPGPMIFRE